VVLDALTQLMGLTEPEHLELRALATDTIGTVALAVGRTVFDVSGFTARVGEIADQADHT
jgi:hypothetical protein